MLVKACEGPCLLGLLLFRSFSQPFPSNTLIPPQIFHYLLMMWLCLIVIVTCYVMTLFCWCLSCLSLFTLAASSCQPLSAVPSGYPNPTRYPVFCSIPDPTRFSFRNRRVAGNPKHRVLPDISGITRNRKTIPSSGALLWEPQKGPQGAKKVQNLPF